MKKRLKINGIIITLAVLSAVIFSNTFMRHVPVGLGEEILEIFGIALILLGQIIRVSARGYKSDYSAQGVLLIQGGPYSLVRNPMYLGILLIGVGIVLVLFKWWVICLFLLVFISRYISLMHKEEKKLLSLFPGDYPGYKKAVPRILPSIGTIFRKEISQYLPLRPSWIKKEIGSILVVLLLTLLIESWEDIKTEGWAVYQEEALTILIAVILFMLLLIYLAKRTEGVRYNDSSKSKNN